MEQWAIDVDASKESPLDPIVTILDADLQPVLRTQLLATRESYFTFRGKDSMQVGDFRLFNWQEMHLDDYLYSSGEVTRLWLYPRGPDSGYNVYPNEGQRWTYFGTTHTTHALGEPAYVGSPSIPVRSFPLTVSRLLMSITRTMMTQCVERVKTVGLSSRRPQRDTTTSVSLIHVGWVGITSKPGAHPTCNTELHTFGLRRRMENARWHGS